MSKRNILCLALLALSLTGLVVAGCASRTTTKNSTPTTPTVLPVAANPIKNDATVEGLKITDAMVENNVDPVTKKALSDQLQISLQNTATAATSGLEIYYKMTDSVTKKTEGYYQKLTGLKIEPGQTTTIYFDNKTGAGHYPENNYSIYRTSKNEVVISLEVSTPGLKPATFEVKKSIGTSEKQD